MTFLVVLLWKWHFKEPHSWLATFRNFSRRETKMIKLTFTLQQHNLIIGTQYMLEDHPKNSSSLTSMSVSPSLCEADELFFFFLTKSAVYIDLDTPCSLHLTWFICPFSLLNRIWPKNKQKNNISANMTRISHDDSAWQRRVWLAFLLYHSSLQGMKMSNKWHHCCV